MPTEIGDYELVDIGIEHAQYFHGFGCSYTSYSECAVGIGNDPREALDDCLEQVAQSGFNVEELERRILAEFPDFNNQKMMQTYSVPPNFDDESHYHIGLRWNPAS